MPDSTMLYTGRKNLIVRMLEKFLLSENCYCSIVGILNVIVRKLEISRLQCSYTVFRNF